MDAADRRNRAGAEAAHWLVRLQSGDMERSEREQFVDWLQESHIHIGEMLRVAQVHGALEQFDGWASVPTAGSKSKTTNVVELPSVTSSKGEDPVSPQQNTEMESRGQHARRERHSFGLGRARLFLAAAAAVAVVLVGGTILVPQIRGRVIETERGERREVVLSDGSLVQVDPETRLRVKYADAVRQVFLEHGRALFHVAKNANRPFMVRVDGTTVRAVGTAFGVERQPQGIVVTVSEGRVAVLPTTASLTSVGTPETSPSGTVASNPEKGARLALPVSKSRERRSPAHPDGKSYSATSDTQIESPQVGSGSLYLTANQQVTVERGGTADAVREVDSQRELAWAEGRLIFQNDEMSKVISEFNRYNRVQLTVTDAALASRPITGVFNASDPEAFIAFLQTVAPVEIARDGYRRIMIGSPRHH